YINEVPINMGLEPEDLYGKNNCIFQKIIHPEDYHSFLEHLSCLKVGDEKEIMVRVKEVGGDWTDYCFKNHIYNWSSTGDDRKAVLSLGYKLPDLNIEKDDENTDCDDLPLIETVPDAYNHLLNSIDESYCIVELIYDREGKPVDYLFHETNRAFEEQTNLRNVTGKTMREIEPNIEEHWFETYGKVAMTGKPLRFQEHSKFFDNSWLDIYTF